MAPLRFLLLLSAVVVGSVSAAALPEGTSIQARSGDKGIINPCCCGGFGGKFRREVEEDAVDIERRTDDKLGGFNQGCCCDFGCGGGFGKFRRDTNEEANDVRRSGDKGIINPCCCGGFGGKFRREAEAVEVERRTDDKLGGFNQGCCCDGGFGGKFRRDANEEVNDVERRSGDKGIINPCCCCDCGCNSGYGGKFRREEDAVDIERRTDDKIGGFNQGCCCDNGCGGY